MLPTCPACKSPVPVRSIKYDRSFECPTCKKLLVIPPIYVVARAFAAVLVSAALLYWIGFRGVILIVGAAASWFPAMFIDAALVRHFLPPLIRIDKEDSKVLKLGL